LTGEVTIDEIMDKYMISSDGKTSTGFAKSILLNDGTNQYSGRLHWDSHDGYSMYWDGVEAPESDRPEFEYILDCITEMDNK
jgi:hypothetical protein